MQNSLPGIRVVWSHLAAALCAVWSAGASLSAQSCALYPIALPAQALAGRAPGDVLPDIFQGQQSGNFGWLTWAGSPSVPTLVASLTPPGNSDTYVNPDNSSDHQINVGDWVQGKPGVSSSKNVRDALDALKLIDITVPVWSETRGQGQGAAYRVLAFARVRILDYHLPGQNRITARFLGYETCDAVNEPPVVSAGPDQTITLPAAASLNGTVSDDGLPAGGTLTVLWSVLSGPGTVTFGNAAAAATTASFSTDGTYSLRLTASDSQLAASDDVLVTVNRGNQAPVANGQSLTNLEDTALDIVLTGSDADADALSFFIVSHPSHGALTGLPPNVHYTPFADYNGSDSFTFKVNDGLLDSPVATITITNLPVNDAPVADSQSLTNFEDTPLPLTLSGADVEGSALTFLVVNGPSHGTLTFNSPLPNSQPAVYTPATNYNGPDSFTFTVNDGQLDSAPATVSIQVISVNDVPLVNAGPDQLVTLPVNSVTLAGTVTDDFFDGSTLLVQWTMVSGPGTVTFADATTNHTTATFSASGIYVLRLTADDGFLVDYDDAVITVNAPPLVNAGTNQIITLPDAASLNGAASDDGLPTNGTFTVNWTKVAGPGTVVFSDPASTNTTASFGDHGVYTLRLTASDGAASTTSDVIVTVNRAPIVDAGSDQTNRQDQVTFLQASVSDEGLPVGGTLTIQWSGQGPGNVFFADGNATNTTVTFSTPGVYVLTATASDGLATSQDQVVITVTAPNTAPVADAQSLLTEEDTPLPIALTGSDAEDDVLTFTVTSPPFFGTLTAGAQPFTFHYSPFTDYYGPDSFSYIANDGQLDSAPATVSIEVLPVNDAPVADFMLVETDQNTPVNFTLTGSDIDGDTITFVFVTPPAHGTLIGDAPNLAYTPVAGYVGPDSFFFLVNDGVIDSNPAEVAITVRSTENPLRLFAGRDHVLVGTFSASLKGRASYVSGSPPGPTAFTWSVVEQPVAGAANFADVHDPMTSVSFGALGAYRLRLTAADGQNSRSDDVRFWVMSPPPEPSLVAPPVDLTEPTSVAKSTAFLYSGANPVQVGVAVGTIVVERAAVVRGRVTDRLGNGLANVGVTVLDHPELGATTTRTNGWFDLAVNGGGPLTLHFEKPGLITAQRRTEVPWQDYVTLVEIVMVPYDVAAAAIVVNQGATQTAVGGVMSDADGSRQAFVVFPPGLSAVMEFPDSVTAPLASLTVRATEYTVGASGHRAMPAELPPSSGYTYCAELSVDEAVATEASSVRFDQPVSFYVENFLGFPAGTAVPVGFYDRDQGFWVPSTNGRVIQIVGISAGLATVDVDGSGNSANQTQLDELHFTATELATLAGRYAVGQSLWRAQIDHFTPFDLNWCFFVEAMNNQIQPPQLPTAKAEKRTEDPCIDCGSIIDIQNQMLGESLPVTGTPFTLRYTSDRVPGRSVARTLQIPIRSGEASPAPQQILVNVSVAGQEWRQTFNYASTTPGQTLTFMWDGRDIYGRTLQSQQRATVRIGYSYRMFYVDLDAGGPLASFFMAVGLRAVPFQSPVSRQEAPPVVLWQSYDTPVEQWDTRALGMGGWTLDAHHTYVPEARTLVMGDGSRRSPLTVNAAVKRVGANLANFVAAGPDGSLFFNDNQDVIRRMTHDGVVSLIGGGGADFPADGQLATNVFFGWIDGLAVGPDGGVYCADALDGRVWKIGMDGRLKLMAGSGLLGYTGDYSLAINARFFFEMLPDPVGMAVGPDSSLYICDYNNHALRRITTDGIITTVAGGAAVNTADNIPANEAALAFPSSVAITPEGEIYVADTAGIHHISRDGLMSRVSTITPAVALAFAPNHSLYVLTSTYVSTGNVIGPQYHIVEIKPDGQEVRIAGADAFPVVFPVPVDYNGVGALDFPLNTVSLAVTPDNTIYFGTGFRWGDPGPLWRVSTGLPGLSAGDRAYPSARGNELYIFTGAGKHLRTLDTLTGQTLFEFTYNANGSLITVADLDGDATVIERDGNGLATAIVSADGHRTTLGYDANGWLNRIANPANEAFTTLYTADGLMTEFRNPRLNASTFTYDTGGRLRIDADAAGGSKTLTRIDYTNGLEVAVSTAMNYQPARHRVLFDTNLTEYHENIGTDGTTNRTWTTENGITTAQGADGTVSISKDGADPRWGLQAPFTAQSSVTLPGGNQLVASRSRSVALSDPDNPLSLASQTDIVTINGLKATNTYSFDGVNRVMTSISPLGRTATSALDNKGRVVQTAVPGIAPVDLQYDARGRLLSMSQAADGQTRNVSHTYDTTQNGGPSSGRLVATTDSLNRTTTFAYDPNFSGRVTRQTFPNGRFIEFQYDANGNLTGVTPPQKPVHLFAFDARDLVSQYDPPPAPLTANNFTTYAYNLNRQLTNVTRPDGLQINFTYNSVTGWLDRVDLPLGERITWQYGDVGCGCSEAGRPSGVTFQAVDYTSALSFTYDGSLVTGVAWSGPVAGSVTAGYDNFFRVNSLSVNGASPVSFVYDADGLLTQAGALTLARDPLNGRLTGTTLGTVNDSWTYNGFGEAQTYTSSAGSSALYAMSFTRDNAGRITTKTETIGGVTSAYTYTYHSTRGWLTDVASNGVAAAHYDYDDNGNRTYAVTLDREVTYAPADDQDRIFTATETQSATGPQSVSWTYSANGELQTKTVGAATTGFSYDVRGSLRDVTLPNGAQIAYVIDAMGRRIGRRINGALVQGWLYQNSLKPIAELDGSGAVVSRFIYAGKVNVPEYIVRGGVTYRLLTDHLGSVRLVMNAASGAIVQRLDYDEYGRVLLDTSPGFQPFGFAGGLYDPDTSLVRFGARDYDAETGRWTSKDPIGFKGGSANLFVYVNNNPLNEIDPFGLAEICDKLKFAEDVRDKIQTPLDYTQQGLDFANQYKAWENDKATMGWSLDPSDLRAISERHVNMGSASLNAAQMGADVEAEVITLAGPGMITKPLAYYGTIDAWKGMAEKAWDIGKKGWNLAKAGCAKVKDIISPPPSPPQKKPYMYPWTNAHSRKIDNSRYSMLTEHANLKTAKKRGSARLRDRLFFCVRLSQGKH